MRDVVSGDVSTWVPSPSPQGASNDDAWEVVSDDVLSQDNAQDEAGDGHEGVGRLMTRHGRGQGTSCHITTRRAERSGAFRMIREQTASERNEEGNMNGRTRCTLRGRAKGAFESGCAEGASCPKTTRRTRARVLRQQAWGMRDVVSRPKTMRSTGP